MKQQTLFEMNNLKNLFIPKKGKRKSARPLSRKHPIHLVMKSSRHNLRRNERGLHEQWSRLAKRWGIKTYRLVVASDHLHVVVKIQSRECYRKFISGFTGLVSRRFQIQWKTKPATRLVEWGRAFKTLIKYIQLNEWEALGYIEYQPERTRNLPAWLKL
ncbi:MAG: transposase [Bdellovibrionales bacterium]